jgi:very-short-patch-repair endonuclease
LPKVNLIIEVDGAYHSERQQQEDDDIRERELVKMNYNIIRFSNDEVLYSIEAVIDDIFKELANYE